MENPQYNTDIVKSFINWSVLWGVVAILVGVIASLQMTNPELNFPPLSYIRSFASTPYQCRALWLGSRDDLRHLPVYRTTSLQDTFME